MGTPAITSRRDLKGRFSSAESLVTPGIVVEVKVVPGIKRGGACSGHRLDRIPSGDTRLVSAPLYGRCLLVEANLCANCDGPGLTNTSNLRRTGSIVKRFGFRSPRVVYLICMRGLSLEALVWKRRGERLVQEEHFLDWHHVA